MPEKTRCAGTGRRCRRRHAAMPAPNQPDLVEVENAIRSRRTVKAFERRAGRPRDARRAARARALGAEPPPHEPVALPGARPQALERAEGRGGRLAPRDGAGGRRPRRARRGGGGQARPRPDAGRLLREALRRPGPGRGGRHATACAAYIVLLGAHARGLAGYWRTPAVLRTEAGATAVGLPATSISSACCTSAAPCQTAAPPDRAPVTDYATFLE